MKNPIRIFVFILALAAGLSGVWFLRLMIFPPVTEIGDLTSHNPVLPSRQRAEPEPVKPDTSNLRPCDAGDDYRWEDMRPGGSGTIQDGILNGRIRCGVFPQFSPAKKTRTVWVNVLVDYDGRVIRAKGGKGNPLLIGQAITAAYQTRFAPRLIDGKSYRVRGVLFVFFNLEGETKVKKQDIALCGEILNENDKTYIVPLAKVPPPVRTDFQYAWKFEIVNPGTLQTLSGLPVVLQNWGIETSPAQDRARVVDYKLLVSGELTGPGYIVFGDVANPGWSGGFVSKIYADGHYVTSNNFGECKSYGNLSQVKVSFQNVRQRLSDEGLLEIVKEPVTTGADHYRIRFVELGADDGSAELRTDDDSFQNFFNDGHSKKRDDFELLYGKEKAFIKFLQRGGFKLPKN